MAGALGIRLGGRVFRKGEAHDNPFIGDPLNSVEKNQIVSACSIMNAAALVFTLFMVFICSVCCLI
jgi:cobalamin biosynthesis protein CobD/CbiB